MFANHGVHVHGVDVNEKAVNMIQNKQLHIEETGLQERLDKAIDEGYLRFLQHLLKQTYSSSPSHHQLTLIKQQT